MRLLAASSAFDGLFVSSAATRRRSVFEEPELTKRQCQSCGFFQPAPSDGVGWCQHPKRKNSSDIRLYVRGAELPCRNDWNHDLWVDKATFIPPRDFDAGKEPVPLAPVSLDDVVFLTSSQRPPDGVNDDSATEGSAVDRVIREETTFSRTPTSTPDAIRGSVRRAHQRVLAEKRVERFADGAAPAADGGFSVPPATTAPAIPKERRYEPIGGAAAYAPTRPVFSQAPPINVSEADRSQGKIVTYPGEEDQFITVPRRVDGVALPRSTRREAGDAVIPTPMAEDGNVVEESRMGHAPSLENSSGHVALRGAPVAERWPEPDERPADETLSVAASVRVEAAPEPVDDITDESYVFKPQPQKRRGGLFRSRRKPVFETSDDDDEIWDVVPDVVVTPVASDRAPGPDQAAFHFSVDAERTLAPSVERQPPPEVDRIQASVTDWTRPHGERTAVGKTSDGLSSPAADLWADVPRMCRTCRDFRPAESGERGWCTNKWAFKHRRMVDAIEMPCESAVGCWWLPSDDVWLSVSDISAHGQATPLLDLWCGQRRDRDHDQDSPVVRRRQRG